MKHKTLLTVSCLISIVLFPVHVAGDIVRGVETGKVDNVIGSMVICVVWLCGTLLLHERRAGRVIMFLGSVLAAGVPILHMKGAGVGGPAAKSTVAFLFICPLFLLGVSGAFSLVLLALGLRRRATMKAVENEGPDRRG
jgi:hypothetical protein